MKKTVFLGLIVLVWLALIGWGGFFLLTYAKTPGLPAHPPSLWPSQTSLERNPNQMTLLMFVHPRCPCTRASIGELAHLMARCHGKLEAQVVFIKPGKFSEDWVKKDLWRSAQAIPGVKARIDQSGEEAKRFHALTSGQTLLYGRDGRLLFKGGITAARGHSGDNAGRSAVESIVFRGLSDSQQTPVFGCPLRDQPHQLLKRFSLFWKR